MRLAIFPLAMILMAGSCGLVETTVNRQVVLDLMTPIEQRLEGYLDQTSQEWVEVQRVMTHLRAVPGETGLDRDAWRDPILAVVSLHEREVRADAALDPDRRDAYLRSGEILRRLFERQDE